MKGLRCNLRTSAVVSHHQVFGLFLIFAIQTVHGLDSEAVIRELWTDYWFTRFLLNVLGYSSVVFIPAWIISYYVRRTGYLEREDQHKVLVDDIIMLTSEISSHLKLMKLSLNQLSASEPLVFSRDDVKILREAADQLDSNQFKTNVGMTVGSGLGFLGGALGIAGLTVASGGVLLGVGMALGITGSTTTAFSTANRVDTQNSCSSNVEHALQKFCLIPEVLQGIIYCYGPFLKDLQEGDRDMRTHVNKLDKSKLEAVKRVATKIKQSITNDGYQATLEKIFYLSEACKKLVHLVYGDRRNWLDLDDEKEVCKAIAALVHFATVNDIKSLKIISSGMGVVKISGIALGLSGHYMKAASVTSVVEVGTVANKVASTGTSTSTVKAGTAAKKVASAASPAAKKVASAATPAAKKVASAATPAAKKVASAATPTSAAKVGSVPNVSKFARAMKVAGISLQAVGMALDLVIFTRAVKNMLDHSPSELSQIFRDTAEIIENFMLIRDF